jgi:uncharacterized protein YcfJ
MAAIVVAGQAGAQVTFFENDGFQGRSFNPGAQLSTFSASGFNDRASSAIVTSGRWEVCEDDAFAGRCMVLRPGQYPSFNAMSLNDRISSVRPVTVNAYVTDDRYAPLAPPAYDNRRRRNERLFQANVTSVRAVVGTPEQRCWVEPEQVSQPAKSNVGGAVVGALIGGILGHQVGGGAGKDLATVGGVIAGGAIGAQVGRGGNNTQTTTQNVQRCTTMPSQATPALWDVGYNFRGQDHQVQMTTQPGQTIVVNRNGEPRT